MCLVRGGLGVPTDQWGGSPSGGGCPRGLWVVLLLESQGRQQVTHSFNSLRLLSFPPHLPHPVTVISSRRNRSPQLQHAWPGRPLLTTFTLHSSARMFVPVRGHPCHCCLSCHSPGSQPPLRSHPPTFGYIQGWITQMHRCAVQMCLFFVMQI